jgi:hypothetical protein
VAGGIRLSGRHVTPPCRSRAGRRQGAPGDDPRADASAATPVSAAKVAGPARAAAGQARPRTR